MIIPCVKKGHADEGIIWINTEKDVTHLLRTPRKVEFHTDDGVYLMANSLDHWKDALEDEGFSRIDWGILVNLNKISEFDDKQEVVYLNGAKVKRKGLTVAKRNIQKIKDYLTGKKND